MKVVEIKDKGTYIEVKILLPFISREGITAEINNNVLQLRARLDHHETMFEKNQKIVYDGSGLITVSVPFGVAVDPDVKSAKFVDNELIMKVDKLAGEPKGRHSVRITR